MPTTTADDICCDNLFISILEFSSNISSGLSEVVNVHDIPNLISAWEIFHALSSDDFFFSKSTFSKSSFRNVRVSTVWIHIRPDFMFLLGPSGSKIIAKVNISRQHL